MANGQSTNPQPNRTLWSHPPYLIGIAALIFFIIDLVLLVIFKIDHLCFFCGALEDSWRDSLFGIVALIFGFIIFNYQNNNSDKQDKILANLHELMLDYAPFRLAPAKASEIFLKWIDQDTKTNKYIFYFPYSIIPGFWNDTGREFDREILDRLESEDHKSPNHYVFIGPALENSLFSEILDMMEIYISNSDKRLELINSFKKNYDFWNLFENYENDLVNQDFAQTKQLIINRYKRNLDRLQEQSKIKSNVTVILTGQNEAFKDWQMLSNCSFILKYNAERENELIYIDPYNQLTSNIGEIHKQSQTISNNPNIFLTVPNQYHTTNRKIISLFISTIIECCFCKENIIES